MRHLTRTDWILLAVGLFLVTYGIVTGWLRGRG